MLDSQKNKKKMGIIEMLRKQGIQSTTRVTPAPDAPPPEAGEEEEYEVVIPEDDMTELPADTGTSSIAASKSTAGKKKRVDTRRI
jgi:hypothetical protein